MSILRGVKNKSGPRPAWETIYPYAFVLFLSYAAADVFILAFRDTMLPTQAPPTRPRGNISATGLDRGAFNTIISRNIFNSDGIIPPALNGGGSDSPQEKDADPVPSQLPLTLVGTLVHSNPEKSIAAVEVKSKGQVVSYTPNKEIEGLAVVERVERMRLILRNLSNNRLEYIEIQQEGRLSFGTAAKSEPSAGVIKKVSENEFSISRSNLQAQLSDMSTILRQARALPAYDSGGNIYGFRVTQIEPGSIYTDLGLVNGDVITGVNGNPVTSAQQAMEMYQNLRNSSQIEIQIERNGRREVKKYNVTPQ